MAKSKYAPALFEVISSKDDKSPAKLSLPQWWRSKVTSASPAQSLPVQDPARPTDSMSPTAQADAISVSPVAPAVAGGDGFPSPSAGEAHSAVESAAVAAVSPQNEVRAAPGPGRSLTDERPPVARVHDGRFELSLNSTNLAIAGGILVIGLLLAYEIGRGLSKSHAPGPQVARKVDDLDAAPGKPANPAALNVPTPPRPEHRSGRPGTGSTPVSGNPSKGRPAQAPIPLAGFPPTTPPSPVPAAPAGPTHRIAGLTYVVLESFKHDDKADAEQLRQWLKGKGVETTVEPSGERWQLVSTQGYDYNKDSKRCDEFRTIVKELGKQYKAEFGTKARYDMREPGLKKQK